MAEQRTAEAPPGSLVDSCRAWLQAHAFERPDGDLLVGTSQATALALAKFVLQQTSGMPGSVSSDSCGAGEVGASDAHGNATTLADRGPEESAPARAGAWIDDDGHEHCNGCTMQMLGPREQRRESAPECCNPLSSGICECRAEGARQMLEMQSEELHALRKVAEAALAWASEAGDSDEEATAEVIMLAAIDDWRDVRNAGGGR